MFRSSWFFNSKFFMSNYSILNSSCPIFLKLQSYLLKFFGETNIYKTIHFKVYWPIKTYLFANCYVPSIQELVDLPIPDLPDLFPAFLLPPSLYLECHYSSTCNIGHCSWLSSLNSQYMPPLLTCYVYFPLFSSLSDSICIFLNV